jgi:hypothetical protein
MKKRRVAALAASWLIAVGAQAIEVDRLEASERVAVDALFDEPVWTRSKPFDRFWDVSPQDQRPARVRTEVRFAYDRSALYVAVRAWDPQPEAIRAPFARRDNVLADQKPIPSHEATRTVSLVYGHYVNLGTTFYVGATASRSRIPEAGVRGDPLELFAKGSWSLDIF